MVKATTKCSYLWVQSTVIDTGCFLRGSGLRNLFEFWRAINGCRCRLHRSACRLATSKIQKAHRSYKRHRGIAIFESGNGIDGEIKFQFPTK